MEILDLEKGCLAHIIFNDAYHVNPECFRVEALRGVYSLFLDHRKKYKKCPSRDQLRILVKSCMNGAAGIASKYMEQVYDLEPEVSDPENRVFYEDKLKDLQRTYIVSSRIDGLITALQEHNGTDIAALTAASYAEISDVEHNSKETVISLHDVFELPSSRDQLLTGFNSWDEFGGMPVTTHAVICGNTGFGKSLVGLNLMMNMYELNDVTVAFFTVEMARQEVLSRMIATLSGIPFAKIFTDNLSGEERLLAYYHLVKFSRDKSCAKEIHEEMYGVRKQKYIDALKTSSKSVHDYLCKKFPPRENKFVLIDNPSLDIAMLDVQVDSMVKNENLKAFCVDHMHRMRRTDPKQDVSVSLGQMSDFMAEIALRHEIICVALAQSNKENSMPAQSYSVEHSATLFVKIDPEESDKTMGIMAIKCAKSRNMPWTDLTLCVNKDTMELSN
jgi:replicative DNA helicase